MRAAFLLAWTGFLISWVYLRFVKKCEDEGTGMRLRGDPSTLFSFASFFPEVTQPYISQVSDPMYSVFTGIGLLRPFTMEETSAGDDLAHARNAGELPSIANPRGTVGEMPNSRQREEAERRRRLALEALDQRLAAASQRGKPQPKGRVSVPCHLPTFPMRLQRHRRARTRARIRMQREMNGIKQERENTLKDDREPLRR